HRLHLVDGGAEQGNDVLRSRLTGDLDHLELHADRAAAADLASDAGEEVPVGDAVDHDHRLRPIAAVQGDDPRRLPVERPLRTTMAGEHAVGQATRARVRELRPLERLTLLRVPSVTDGEVRSDLALAR